MPQFSLWRSVFVALTFFTCSVVPCGAGSAFADEAVAAAEPSSDPAITTLAHLDWLDARLAEHWRSLDASLAEGDPSGQAVSQADVAELVQLLGQVETQLRHLAVEPELWSERTRTADERLRELSLVLAGGARQPRHTVEPLSLERSGRIAGRITDAGGEPFPEAWAEFWHQEHGYAGSARTDEQGRFESDGLVAGPYAVVAYDAEHRRELYDAVACPGGLFSGCRADESTPVVVALDTTTAGIDFTLDSLGSVAGRVFDAATDEPFVSAVVTVVDVDGRRQESTMTDASGAYSIGGLADGEYFVWVRTSGDYVDEVYDDIVCDNDGMSGSCDPTLGTPVTVRLATTADNIDFGLDLGGEITGRVRAAAAATPIEGITVVAYDADGRSVRASTADETGRYQITGLPTGTYYAVASDDFQFGQYASQVYDDRTCPERVCDPLDGDPIDVTVRRQTTNIDFDLLPKGTIEGRVLDTETGLPIPNAQVTAFGMFFDRSSVSDADGFYEITGLPTDSYTLRAVAFGWFSTLYPAIPCHRDCDVSTGQAVAATVGSTTTGIDIAMRPAGSLSGTALPSSPDDFSLFDITLYDEVGEPVDGLRTDPVSASYRFTGLEAGNYFVVAENGAYRSEVYDDRPCASVCRPLDGDPVRVDLGSETTGIDFVMDRLPTISGTVADADSGLGLGGISIVRLHTADGQVLSTTSAGPLSMNFQTEPIPPGTYFATLSAEPGEPYWVFGAGRCEGFCDPTTGTPIRAELNSDITGIDFRVRRQRGIVGRVTAGTTDIGVAGIDISVWNADTLELVTSTRTGPTGGYSVGAFPGDYFITTSNDQGAADEIWDDVPCPGGPTSNDCDLDAAERVVVGDGLTTDIDFALDGLDVACQASDTTLCLNQGRFSVQATWRDANGVSDVGRVREITNDTGYFWFFDADNVEVVVKVLDACVAPFDRFWVFAAGLTDVEVSLTVTDFASGETRRYDNALGTPFQPVLDTDAFATCDAGFGVRGPAPVSTIGSAIARDEVRDGALEMDCPAGADTLCLGDQRFHVEAIWRSADGGGTATAERLTDDTGYFWFFGPDNVEVVVKVLDACGGPFDRFWVFAAGLTDVEMNLRVIDTETGQEREYLNVLGTPFQPVLDTDAFATCSP